MTGWWRLCRLIRWSMRQRRPADSISERSSPTFQLVWLSGLIRARYRVGWPRTAQCRWYTAAVARRWCRTRPRAAPVEALRATRWRQTASCSGSTAATTRSPPVPACRTSVRRWGGRRAVAAAVAAAARWLERPRAFCTRLSPRRRASRQPRSRRPSLDRRRWRVKDRSGRPGCRQSNRCRAASRHGCLRRRRRCPPAGDSAPPRADFLPLATDSVLCSRAPRRSLGWCRPEAVMRDWLACRTGSCFSIANSSTRCSTWQRWNSSSSSMASWRHPWRHL